MFYLPMADWSARFEPTFFTVDIDSHCTLSSAPAANGDDDESGLTRIGGKTTHPAVYYNIQVFCVHRTQTCPRRYSQFKWLYDRLRSSPPDIPPEAAAGVIDSNNAPIRMPSPTICSFCRLHDEEFIEHRQEELMAFLGDLLKRPGYAAHPAVETFLELHNFSDLMAENDAVTSGSERLT